jgi:flagellar motor switch protein FliN
MAKSEIDSFFERWTSEFTTAIEMFTGEAPVLTHARIEHAATAEWSEQSAGRLWWKQTVEGQGSFSCWVGATTESWTGIGGAVDDKSDPRQMYLEMLGQANQGTVAVISAGFPTPLRCGDGLEEEPAELSSFELAEIKVTFRGAELPSLLLAIEPEAEHVLRQPEDEDDSPEVSASVGAASTVHAPPSIAAAAKSPMMNRLMDLRLPVSVLLGRSSISIREVLRLSTGSLIELDRQIGDYVEIVIHGTLVARGEIVSVNGNYGVRIKEIISREDRIALRDAA